MSFSYHVLHHDGKQLYHRIEEDLITGKIIGFSFSKDNESWENSEITFDKQDALGVDYKVKGEHPAYDCKLRVLEEAQLATKLSAKPDEFIGYKSNKVLIYRKKGEIGALPVFYYLEPISINSLPPSLQAIEHPSTTNPSPQIETPVPIERPKQAESQQTSCCSGTTMQLIGLFAGAIGITALALALTVLSGGALLGIGIGAILVGTGFFAMGTYRNCQSTELDSANQPIMTF